MKKLLVFGILFSCFFFTINTVPTLSRSASQMREEFYQQYPNIFDNFSPKYKQIIYNYIIDPKNKVKLIAPGEKYAQSFGVTVAWTAIAKSFNLYSYVLQDYLNFVDLKTMRGQRSPVNLENFERYKNNEAECQKNLKMSCQEAKERLVGLYKLHLMPKPDDFNTVVLMFLEELQKNPKLQELVQLFKIRIDPDYKNIKDPALIMPKIVLYAAEGKDKVQELLNIIADIYKKREGANISPRFNEQITSLIYYTQGDGTDKKESTQQYFEPGFRHYKKDFTGKDKDRDYHLINPFTGKRVD